ncbi:MAG: type I secretion system permease/ATPase [Verrucomicrobiales bacterium]|nr:type I secretion system permease/ATPase [Verrucomicrobiales bacterium]
MNQQTPDYYLNGLRYFGRHYGTNVNPGSVLHGLPLVDNKLSAEIFQRAAAKCGIEAKLVKRSLSQLGESLYPIIVLTKKGTPYMLLSRNEEGADIHMLDGTQREVTLSWDDVKKSFSGYVILAKRAFEFEKRSDFSPEKPKKSWFWGTLWKFRGLYARVGVATIFINVFAVTSSVFVMNVYDRVVPNQAQDTLFVLATGALIAFGFEFIMKSLRTFFVDRAGHRADLIMGGMLYEQMLGMKFSKRPASAGALASQARAYEGLREFFASATITALIDLPFVFVFAFIVYLLGGIVAAPMVVGLLLALAVGAIMQWPISHAVRSSYQATNQRQAQTVETLNALETIKTVGAESVLASKMQSCVHQSAKSDAKSRLYSQTAVNLTALIQHVVSVAIIVLAFFQVTDDKMTMGAMIACVLLAGRGMAPVGMLASLLTRLQQSRRSLQGLNDIMQLPVDRPDDGLGIDLTVFTPSIKANKVAFSHEVGQDQKIDILQDVSFKIESGDRVALLGKIGSGKSTLIRLIMGLYEPDDGAIEISGVDLRQLNPSQYRRRIGYISQDSGLLYGTLRSNLTAGAPWLTEETVWQAVERAGLAELVHAHPSGIDLPIAEGGTSLSGGQRQLVCLARAIVEEPDILILDEPTSAMDPATEKKFMRQVTAYLNEDRNRILVMATHKRSMLSMVERIIALDGGKKIGDGPKESILTHSRSKDDLSVVKPNSVRAAMDRTNARVPVDHTDVVLPN